MINLIVGNLVKYRCLKKIGSGSFGEIYQGINLSTGDHVAIKLEDTKAGHRLLDREAQVYKHLTGVTGVSFLKWHGLVEGYRVIVLDLLGPNLEDLFNFCQRKFSLKTVLMIAEQLLIRIENLHTRNYIHRDIKPDNFLIGIGRRENQMFMVDFGLSKKYRDFKTNQHIPYREQKSLTGTARYASINTHRGREQSRRDDMISLAYMLIYFLRGNLPWQGIIAETKQQKYQKILDIKESITTAHLCRDLPVEFEFFINYANALEFHDQPDYLYIRRLFQELFNRKRFVHDCLYDWRVITIRTGQSFIPTAHSSNPLPAVSDLKPLSHREDGISKDFCKQS